MNTTKIKKKRLYLNNFIRFTYHRRQYDKAKQYYQQVVG